MEARVLDDFVVRVTSEKVTLVEDRIRLVVQPRPRGLPERVWRRVLARLLVIEERPVPRGTSREDMRRDTVRPADNFWRLG